MRSSQNILCLGASILCVAGIAKSTYTIEDTFDSTNFFNDFSFFTGSDPTDGYVEYLGAVAANQSALAGYSAAGVYLGVDHTTTNPSGGRNSVRVSSNKAYTHGLFIADIAHMPGSTCGVWPAFWTVGPNWPSSGEIDIIEGVNDGTTNTVTLHTSATCNMGGTGSLTTSKLNQANCNSGNGNDGCGFSTGSTQGYGDGFNALGGGVYAMEWTSSAINVHFFTRNAIPSDITSGSPNPSGWGSPQASFSGSGCSIDDHFMNHNIVFDTTFCGAWAGATNVWDATGSSCGAKAATCNDFVGNNPAAFVDSYWLINSVKVYQDSGATKREEGLTPVPFLA